MAKKRSMPHGRTASKAKKARAYTPSSPTADIERPESNDTSLTVPPHPAPVTMAPRIPPRPLAARTSRSGATGLSTDYRYVISDLKRIAVLAGGTIAVLIGLTFVIK